MRILIALALLTLIASQAQADSKLMIGGVDQRVYQLETQSLNAQLARKSAELARTEATLTLLNDEKKAVEDSLKEVQQKLDWYKSYSGL